MFLFMYLNLLEVPLELLTVFLENSMSSFQENIYVLSKGLCTFKLSEDRECDIKVLVSDTAVIPLHIHITSDVIITSNIDHRRSIVAASI